MVMIVGFARGTVNATNEKFKEDWVFAIAARNCKVANIREYIDTQALASASAGRGQTGVALGISSHRVGEALDVCLDEGRDGLLRLSVR